jgi:superfamily I DNA/RNA helicase
MGSKTVVVLGTVHRTKGLEAERVFVLAPDMIPHPMAKQEWEREGEKNIAWIAATRAKFTTTTPGTLVFCGHVPAIFKSKKAAAVRAEPEAESASLAKEEEAADGHVVGELTDENATRVQKAPLVPMTESVDEDEPPF